VDECKPLDMGDMAAQVCAAGALLNILGPEMGGRALHSSTFQLNLSCFWHRIYPRHPRIPPDTH